MKKNLRWWILGSLLITLYVNFLAATKGINGQLTGSISDTYPSLFTPAGYVFGIWSLIYLGLLGFAGMAIFAPKEIPSRVGELFIRSNVLNVLWMLAWHSEELFLSVIIMAGLLGTLAAINNVIFVQKKLTTYSRWLMKYPFELYLGWISVAAIANVFVWNSARHWWGWGLPALFWAMIMSAIAVMVAFIRLLLKHDYVFPLVMMWALWGIRVKQIASPILGWWIVGLEMALVMMLLYGLIRKLAHKWR